MDKKPVKQMADDELLGEAHSNPFFAQELPPGKEPPNFGDEVLHRDRQVREELQARGFTFATVNGSGSTPATNTDRPVGSANRISPRPSLNPASAVGLISRRTGTPSADRQRWPQHAEPDPDQ